MLVKLSRCIALMTIICVMNSVQASSVVAEDLANVSSTKLIQGTIEKKYYGGRVELSAPLWTGELPTAIKFVKVNIPNTFTNYRSRAALKFSIQSLVPYAEASDARTALNLRFELWTVQGEKKAEQWLSGTDWNPLGGPTVVRWYETDVWDVPGTYNLIIKTHKIVDSDGLISRYQDGLQTLPFIIEAGEAAKKSISCKKGKTTKVFKQKKCPSGWKP